MATNVYKKRDKSKKPTSAGRVSGFGLGMNFGEYYNEDPKTRKERRSQKAAADSCELQELKEKVAQIP